MSVDLFLVRATCLDGYLCSYIAFTTGRYPSIPMRLQDHRQNNRVSVHRPIKVRPANLKDGEFEDISQTENASKRGIYFFTEVARYFVGMRVYVTLPYSASPEEEGRQYFGQVVRVEKTTADKRGVAVQFL
jgi:hypothetical protein